MGKEYITESILQAAQDSRGRILQHAIDMENIMGIYISEHFTKDKDKVEEFYSLILSRVSFESKYQAFIYLVRKYSPEFVTNNPDFHKEIIKLIEERNVFAHWPVDYSEQAISDYENEKSVTYVLIQKRDNKLISRRLMTVEHINDLIKRYWDTNQMLKALIV